MKKIKLRLFIVRPAVLREPESVRSDPYLVCDKITLGYEKVATVPEVSEVGTLIIDKELMLTRVLDVGYDISERVYVLVLEDYPAKRRRRRLSKREKPVDDSVLLVTIEMLAARDWKPKSKVVGGDQQVDNKGADFIARAEAVCGQFPLEVE
jgi:hypothetical protein